MEKVFINPVAKEILIKGGAKEGPVDLFSYDGNGNNRTLGNLFLVGNIQGGTAEASDDIDVGYVLNLVASLAKREYYSNPDLDPKNAFSNALKKINGVVEEFFKKKETKINIGIFTIANEQIHISKLGKFKIFLARDGKNIDILNNIQLFNKESTDEKEFSNIISGKIHEGDRVLAFYPSRSVTAREKSIKDHLLTSSQDEFAAKLATIKEGKAEFACVALHIDVQKGSEAAVAPRIQPKELQEEEDIEEEIEETAIPAAQLTVSEEEPEELKAKEEPKPVARTVSHPAPEPELPKIIPSEFARGKRELAFAKHVRRLKRMNITPRGRMFAMGGIAIVAIIAIVSLKSFVFVSASARQLNTVVAEAQDNLKLAQTKLSQNDLIGARGLLLSSLSSLTQSESTNGSSKKAEEARAKLMEALDGLDQATDATVSVVAEIPTESGTAKLITPSGSNFYAYLDQEGTGAITKITAGSMGSATPIKDISPQRMFATETSVALVDADSKKITSLSISKSTLSTSAFSTDALLDYRIFNDNLYGLTATGIIKITDAAIGHTKVEPWLTDGSLASQVSLLAIDGNLYTLSLNGTLATYYKGKKTNEASTPVSPENGSMLLTNEDSPNLYLINPSSGRIYVIAKASGAVSKTLKLNASNPITSATLGLDDMVYILSDNKIWKIQ